MGAREDIAGTEPASGLAERGRTLVVDRLIGMRQVGRIEDGALGPAPGGAPRIVLLDPGAAALSRHLDGSFPLARIVRVGPQDLEAGEGSADLLAGAFALVGLDPAALDRLAGQIGGLIRPGGALALVEAGGPGRAACERLSSALRDQGIVATVRRHALGRLTTVAGMRPVARGPHGNQS